MLMDSSFCFLIEFLYELHGIGDIIINFSLGHEITSFFHPVVLVKYLEVFYWHECHLL